MSLLFGKVKQMDVIPQDPDFSVQAAGLQWGPSPLHSRPSVLRF